MPAKNIIKSYVSDGVYHVYNRGVNKADIFIDDQDYRVFLSYIATALRPKDEKKLREMASEESLSYKERGVAARELRLKNFTGKIDLLAYCLMPNHFHFLLQQKGESDMSEFVQSVMTRFTMYENSRHKRVGSVFQGTYKAVLITNDAQLLHVSRYIHRNPFSLKRSHLLRLDPKKRSQILRLQPSSYPNYLGEIHQEWVKPKTILSYFSKAKTGLQSYKEFVEIQDYDFEVESIRYIAKAEIDED
ncbi:MAG: transposase [Candidatus Gottesmanbacteria bacterium]|nr:transposase [Candidatus Gottesmanbacteria bacterium]